MNNEPVMRAFRKKLEECLFSIDDIAGKVVDTMTNTGLAVTEKATPVGDYSKSLFVDTKNKRIKYASFLKKDGERVTFRVKSVKLGGTLKKGWRRKKVRKVGNAYVAKYFNVEEYAIYVNNGHRIVRDDVTIGFVPGKRMLEKGMSEARSHLPSIMKHELDKLKKRSGF